MSSTSIFDELCLAISHGKHSAESAAEVLYQQLTDEERLGLLDGDVKPSEFLADIKSGVYGIEAYPAAEIKRIGLPGIRFSDGPRGVMMGRGDSTAFPTSAARAATWNTDLEVRVGRAMGIELRAQGANYSGAVCINLARHPCWGRTQESYGEDPIILGCFGTALTIGLRDNAMACIKHYALNSMENMRFEVDVTCDERTLHEVYLPHFKQCLEEGGAESLMSAYNSVNGQYCGENDKLLNGIVRTQWNMPHILVTTDWIWGLRDGPKSVRSGLDIEMPWRAVRLRTLPIALKKGELSWSDIKKPGLRVLASQLTYYARLRGTPKPTLDQVGCAAHRSLARKVAVEAMVLLKNSVDTDESKTALLPFKRAQHKTVAVIGALAASLQTGDGGSSNVRDNHVVSPLAAFRADPDINVIYDDGTKIAQAKRVAKSADAVFLLVGFTAKDEGESLMCVNPKINHQTLPGWGEYWLFCYLVKFLTTLVVLFGYGAGGDRQSLSLNAPDEKLVNEIVQVAGEKTVLGIEASSAVILPPYIRQRCASILWTGYGGAEFGNALQDVLWGREEPSGRLPFVIPESPQDLPQWQPQAKSVIYDRWFGYRLLQRRKKTAVFPFGFGLGYGEVRIIPNTLLSGDLRTRFFDVVVDVENVGAVDSAAVVQIYAGKTEGRTSIDYERVLIGFAKSVIKSGARLQMTVSCRLNPVAHIDLATNTWQLSPGSYTLWASRYEGDPESARRVVAAPAAVVW